ALNECIRDDHRGGTSTLMPFTAYITCSAHGLPIPTYPILTASLVLGAHGAQTIHKKAVCSSRSPRAHYMQIAPCMQMVQYTWIAPCICVEDSSLSTGCWNGGGS